MATAAELEKKLGPTWCFHHNMPIPCEMCAEFKRKHPFLGRCFDCKRENAGDSEPDTELCGCGSLIRRWSRYEYP